MNSICNNIKNNQDKEKADVYLIQDSLDKKFAGLLTDGSVTAGINELLSGKQYYGSQGPLAGGGSITSSPFEARPTSAPAPRPPPVRAGAATMPGQAAAITTNSRASAVAADVAARRQSVPHLPPGASNIAAAAPDTRRMSMPSPAAPVIPSHTAATTTPVATSSMPPVASLAQTSLPQSDTHKALVTTTVRKGELGIGLDLGKSKTGQGQVLRFKDLPAEVVNPASLCNPPILVGDVIVAVNSVPCASLSETVKIIRSAEGVIQLTLEREVTRSFSGLD